MTSKQFIPACEDAADTAGIVAAERERVRQALHDGLGQLLTSMAFVAGSLRQKLERQGMPEASDASEILTLIGQAISEAQALVQERPSLTPVDDTETSEAPRFAD